MATPIILPLEAMSLWPTRLTVRRFHHRPCVPARQRAIVESLIQSFRIAETNTMLVDFENYPPNIFLYMHITVHNIY